MEFDECLNRFQRAEQIWRSFSHTRDQVDCTRIIHKQLDDDERGSDFWTFFWRWGVGYIRYTTNAIIIITGV